MKGQRVALPAQETLSIGRQNDNHIVLDSPRVSRRHAEIFQHGDHVFLKDLNSQNGTLLNGTKIENLDLWLAVELFPNDQVSLGDYIFKLTQSESVQEEKESSVSLSSLLNPEPQTHNPEEDENNLHIALLYGAYRTLAIAKNKEDFQSKIAKDALQILNAERVCLMNYDEKQKTLIPHFFGNSVTSGEEARFEPSMMVLHHVLNEKKTIFTVDAGSDERFKEGKSIVDPGVRSIICTPLLRNNEIHGAIYFDTLQSEQKLGPKQEQAIQALAELIVTGYQHF
jgi:pSer/pThr/pTyr-binding forkhead associated (FHA) protein